MEVIHLILGKANPDRMNGVNKVVHEMATNEVLHGYAVEVWGITANPVHDYPERIFTTRLFRAYRNRFRIDPQLRQAFLDKKGNAVVHIHGAFLPVFYSVSRFLYHHDIPFIITPHSTYNKVKMKKNALGKKLYFHLFEKPLLNRAFGVHLLGQSEWEGLASIYHNRKSFISPYGFTPANSDGFSPANSNGFTPGQLDAPHKPGIFSVAYCGRIACHDKGLDILLKGFALFNRKFPDTRLVIIGDGKERRILEDLAGKLGIRTAVLFKGRVFGKDKVGMLKECQVFAHPSRTDGLPATIVEAAALGLPCVLSVATNMNAFIDKYDAGYSMKNMEPSELAAGLENIRRRIVDKKEGRLLMTNALRMIDQEFNWTLILRYFDRIYRDALHQPVSPHQPAPKP